MNRKYEILDEPIIDGSNNKIKINRIIQLSIGTIVLFFLLEVARKYVPENLLDWNGVQIKSIGLLIIGIVIINSILIPTYLNKLTPKLSISKIVGFTGLIILGIELVFKIIQSVIVHQNGINLNYMEIMMNVGMISVMSMLIANIRVHKLRNKKTIIPVLILIVLWITIGLIIKSING